jgi:hypothetical protein
VGGGHVGSPGGEAATMGTFPSRADPADAGCSCRCKRQYPRRGAGCRTVTLCVTRRSGASSSGTSRAVRGVDPDGGRRIACQRARDAWADAEEDLDRGTGQQVPAGLTEKAVMGDGGISPGVGEPLGRGEIGEVGRLAVGPGDGGGSGCAPFTSRIGMPAAASRSRSRGLRRRFACTVAVSFEPSVALRTVSSTASVRAASSAPIWAAWRSERVRTRCSSRAKGTRREVEAVMTPMVLLPHTIARLRRRGLLDPPRDLLGLRAGRLDLRLSCRRRRSLVRRSTSGSPGPGSTGASGAPTGVPQARCGRPGRQASSGR